MHMTKIFAFVTILAAGAFAAPAAEANPPKPTKPAPQPQPTNVNQSNACGNGATPYCCNIDNKGKYTTCYAFRELPYVYLLLNFFEGLL